MATKGKAEHFIEDVVGCGRHQLALYLLVVLLVKVSCAFSVTFMAFGNYNPGWRCVENATADTVSLLNVTNSSVEPEKNSSDYRVGSCEEYRACRKVEFNPESSTLVTEWNLLCEHAWKPSVTIAAQMAGMLIGSSLGGQLADRIGRRKTLYASMAVAGVAQLASSFSVSWEMFTVLRFIIALCAINNLLIGYLYISEALPKNWRASVMALPSWQFGALILALAALSLKSWRQVEIVGFVCYVIAFIPFFWVPESLRWLEVNRKTKEFVSTAKKIARMNKKAWSDFEDLAPHVTHKDQRKTYTIIDIFRKGYRARSLGIAFLQGVFSIMYYSITFGVKALHGGFYVNFVLMITLEAPFGLVTVLTLRHMNRRPNSILFLAVFIVCVFTTVGMLFSNSEPVMTYGVAVLVSIAKGGLGGAWYVLFARNTELYPTVVRGIGLGWGSSAARIAGILSPFVIPNERDFLYVYMIAMGVVGIACCLVSLALPETKGKVLQEKFEENEMENFTE